MPLIYKTPIIKYTEDKCELYDLKEFKNENLPEHIDEKARRQLAAIWEVEIKRVNTYIAEVDRFRSSYNVLTKFTPDRDYESWQHCHLVNS